MEAARNLPEELRCVERGGQWWSEVRVVDEKSKAKTSGE